ncbi:hypothetical protein NKH18_34165 [Streptomyces sp. M10(2022)]
MDIRKARRKTAGAVVVALAAALLPWQSAVAQQSRPPPPARGAAHAARLAGRRGEFALTDRARIVLEGKRDARTAADARRFAGELTARTPVSTGGADRRGDIVLRQDPP